MPYQRGKRKLKIKIKLKAPRKKPMNRNRGTEDMLGVSSLSSFPSNKITKNMSAKE
jgi:hypothetical protein